MSSTPATASLREVKGPLANDNKLKLATFGSNCEGIIATPKLSWSETLWAAQYADRLGFEAIVPLSRWRGETGQRSFDTLTWAAGISASTEQAMVFSTIDMSVIHPIVAAKQLATVDHISGGRAAANLVAGWYRAEAEMFGGDLLEHDARYDRAEEWTKILLDLWTAPEFQELNFEGTYYHVVNGFSSPQPLQSGYPPIMNAGSSPRSHEYIAHYADLAFQPGTQLIDFETGREQVRDLKKQAAALGRTLQVFTYVALFAYDTQEEAEETLHRYREENYTGEERERYYRQVQQETRALEQDWHAYQHRTLGIALVVCGTPDATVEQLRELSEMGIDGVLVTWSDWRFGLPYFEREIMPRLVTAGLRSVSG
jgi:dimethylsulfone monooxygenase